MALVLIILMALSVCHFLYDGIILPSIRQHYRNKLFALRDELRWQMIQGIDHNDLAAFNLIHDSINAFVNRLPLINISVRHSFARDLENNEKLKEKIDQRLKIIENCQNQLIKKTVSEVNAILLNTYIANAGGWFIYLIPIALIISTFKTAAIMLNKLTLAPAQEVHKIIPDSDRSVCC